MKRLISTLVFALALVAYIAPTLSIAQSYIPTDILPLGEGTFEPYGLTDAGQVPGSYSQPGGLGQPAVWKDGQLTVLPLLPGTVYGWARNGNSLGHLVGACRSISNGIYASHACVWTNGVVRALPEVPGTDQSAAWAINDAGTIAGNVYSGLNGSFREGVVWSSNTVAKLLPPVAGVQTWARVINESGQLAVLWGSDLSYGFGHCARWTPDVPNGTSGTMTSLDSSSQAMDINNSGVIVGLFGNQPWIWDGLAGYEVPYGGLDWALFGIANGINDAGLVLGDLTDDYGSPFNTFVWDKSDRWGSMGGLRDLNTVLAGSTPSAYPGSLTSGLAINNAGQILVKTVSSKYALLTPSSLLPFLSIQCTTTNTIVISWPSPSTGFMLQQNTNGVSSVNWSNVTAGIQDDGTNKSLSFSSNLGAGFYRLFKP